MGSREVSEKAGALGLIGIEWQNDTDPQHEGLRRRTHVVDNCSSLSVMVDDVQASVSTRVYRYLRLILPFLASPRPWTALFLCPCKWRLI